MTKIGFLRGALSLFWRLLGGLVAL